MKPLDEQLESGYYLARQQGPNGDFVIVDGPEKGSICQAAERLTKKNDVPLYETFGVVYSGGRNMRLMRRQRPEPGIETPLDVRP